MEKVERPPLPPLIEGVFNKKSFVNSSPMLMNSQNSLMAIKLFKYLSLPFFEKNSKSNFSLLTFCLDVPIAIGTGAK